MQWTTADTCPKGWQNLIEMCGGGFHHSPAWLRLRDSEERPLFAMLTSGGQVVGITLGVRHRCRLSTQPRHYYFPTLPALQKSSQQNDVLLRLSADLGRRGAAVLKFGSSEANWLPGPTVTSNGWPRLEYVVTLPADADTLAAQFGATHRRHLRRGCRESWRLRLLEGEQASRILQEVRLRAAQRARARGDAFTVHSFSEAVDAPTKDLNADWGLCTFAATNNAATLAVALVGWAGRRAYFVAGGSTADGYRASAAVWLHWSIMRVFQQAGFVTYNLGGTPESAAQPLDPAHGLYRFKRSFGATIVRRRGAYLVPQPSHLLVHRFTHALAQALPVFAGNGKAGQKTHLPRSA